MDYLFRNIDGFSYFSQKRKALDSEVGSLSDNELQSSDESLRIILKAKHSLQKIEFGELYKRDNGEIEKDISSDHRFAAYFFREPGDGPVLKKARQIAIHLPFSCNKELFEVQPSTTYYGVRPKAEITDDEVIFLVDFFGDMETDEQVQQKVNHELELIKGFAGFLNTDINSFNNSIDPIIENDLSSRRKKLAQDNAILEKLGVKKQAVPLAGFVKPEKKLELKILENREKQIAPSLEMQTYDEIIEIINSLGINFERSCERLRDLGEEPLRDIILGALGSIYQGMASGETFNREGKTDILLRYRDKNLFIAECKIWRDDKYFTDGIAQLLRYLTWRDTKASYIIFSKNKDVKNVIAKSNALLEKDVNYIAKVKEVSDSSTTYSFKIDTKTNNECLLTLHVFDLG